MIYHIILKVRFLNLASLEVEYVIIFNEMSKLSKNICRSSKPFRQNLDIVRIMENIKKLSNFLKIIYYILGIYIPNI